MYYKYLNEPNISRSMQSAFGGINKNARIGGNEFADMQNMSGDAYPLMMPRAKRVIAQKQIVDIAEITNEDGTVETVENPKRLNGILGDVGFCAVWGTNLYYMGKKVDGIELVEGEKKLLAMGANILIYPDAMYYNTVTGENGEMETGETSKGSCAIDLSEEITLEDGTASGGEISVSYIYKGNSQRDITSLKLIPRKVSGTLYNYTELSKQKYLPIRINGGKIEYLYSMDMKYNGGGGTKDISVTPSNEVWKLLPVKTVTLTDALTIETQTNLWNGDNHISVKELVLTIPVAGDLFSVFTEVKMGLGGLLKCDYQWTRKNLPVLDYMCVHDNRVWGCRCGFQVNGETVNEIYCSKLGDFKEWTISSETTTLAGDPYTMSVGDYGAFTGCVSLRGQLLFFKDDLVYRVSGNKPSNFQIDKISENGLQKGCEKSLEIIDGVLFYKSRNGVFAYDGSIPQKISEALGNAYYTDAVAGKHFSKYYITMVSGGKRVMYVYDKGTGVWYAEDSADVRFFAEYDGALYGAVDNDIVCLAGNVAEIFKDTEDENKVRWYAETGDIGLDNPYPKYYHRVLVRMEIDLGARVKVSIDTGESWMLAADFTSAKKQTVTLPVITPRCEHMRIRIDGEGMAKIYSIYYETETVEGN